MPLSASSMESLKESSTRPRGIIARLFGTDFKRHASTRASNQTSNGRLAPSPKRAMGILNVKETVDVPGSVRLVATKSNHSPAFRGADARTSPHSSAPQASFPLDLPASSAVPDTVEGMKKTSDGSIILEPQPEESVNDPLNWPAWRRDVALLSLGFYCIICGGITPLLSAGFPNLTQEHSISLEAFSLTTGLYMMGLAIGSVLASPTAILFGKRPVYLASAAIFIGTCLWAALSSSFASLMAARVFQGMAVSPIECLPPSTIVDMFFLHERAYRIGIYNMLLLGGLNLLPLLSSVVIDVYGWRWVFWIVAMLVFLAFVLLFFFVPESYWERKSTRELSMAPFFLRPLPSCFFAPRVAMTSTARRGCDVGPIPPLSGRLASVATIDQDEGGDHDIHARCHSVTSPPARPLSADRATIAGIQAMGEPWTGPPATGSEAPEEDLQDSRVWPTSSNPGINIRVLELLSRSAPDVPPTPRLHSFSSPYYQTILERNSDADYFTVEPTRDSGKLLSFLHNEPASTNSYTQALRQRPAQTLVQRLKPYHGRLRNDKWLKAMIRPVILLAYPAVLWSSAVYASSVGWLIVISETMTVLYRDPAMYDLTGLQTGLVYFLPLLGGILGTGAAGKLSDWTVRVMSRRNGGLYEPEFRLVMVIPVLVTKTLGLAGFGWSSQELESWIVPSIFFGILSFGCALGATTAMTFCLDSYHQYAAEALVALNLSKNMLHGLIFGLLVSRWLAADGSKTVYMWLSIIQLIVLLTAVPLYMYGKRARMWTVRRNLMGKL
ncbi:hypothetical protein RJ55_05955 [Drechmeria coniospora]|nr:hypothetical protein RJ55_05955 [Drechmeria coniospora]